jgi:hypothetical protein
VLEKRFFEVEESLLLFPLGQFELGFVDLDLSVELFIFCSQIVLDALVGDCDFAD